MIKRIKTLVPILIAFLVVGCTTTETTHPDGTIVRVKTTDAKTIKAITTVVNTAIARGADAQMTK